MIAASPSTGTPADPVGGASAYWLPDGQRGLHAEAVRLAWQAGDGGWAYVSASSTDEQGRRPKVSAERLRAMAHEVARAVQVDPSGTPVTMPFTTAPAPATV